MTLRAMSASRVVAALLCGACAAPAREAPRLLLGTTHTLEDSGVLEELVAAFDSARHGHRLSVVVAGSGEILMMAGQGDLDVLLTHSPDDELAFMAAGRGDSRQPVMHNDFLLVGPAADPAAAATASDAVEAMRRIEDAGAVFISRGDDSGTHRKELALWAEAQIVPGGPSYVEAGTGMADLLRLASQRQAYTLADRATFEVLRGQLQLRVVHEGDMRMRNQYSVIVVAGARNAPGARAFADWMLSPNARLLIAAFGRQQTGRSLFVTDTVAVPDRGEW